MGHPYTRQDLADWIERILDETDTDTREKCIDEVIPEYALKKCYDDDVLWAAAQYGFIVRKCPERHMPTFKANGKWVEADLTLRTMLHRYRPVIKQPCPKCEREYSETL